MVSIGDQILIVYILFNIIFRATKWSEVKSLSRVWLFATPWTVAHQALPSMGFSRQEYWVAISSRGSSWPRDRTRVSCIPGRRFNLWATREAPENPMDSMKKQKIWSWKMSLSGQKAFGMLLGKSGGQLLVASERMKWLGQSGNRAQLCTCLVVKVKSNAVKKIA